MSAETNESCSIDGYCSSVKSKIALLCVFLREEYPSVGFPRNRNVKLAVHQRTVASLQKVTDETRKSAGSRYIYSRIRRTLALARPTLTRKSKRVIDEESRREERRIRRRRRGKISKQFNQRIDCSASDDQEVDIYDLFSLIPQALPLPVSLRSVEVSYGKREKTRGFAQQLGRHVHTHCPYGYTSYKIPIQKPPSRVPVMLLQVCVFVRTVLSSLCGSHSHAEQGGQ